MPPTKPTLPVLDASAASTPTRNEPSCSLKVTDCTLGSVHHAVDDGEVHVGEFLGDLLERDGLREADGDDRILPALGKTPMRLLELRLVAGLELGDGDAGFLVERSAPWLTPSLKDLSNLPPVE